MKQIDKSEIADGVFLAAGVWLVIGGGLVLGFVGGYHIGHRIGELEAKVSATTQTPQSGEDRRGLETNK